MSLTAEIGPSKATMSDAELDPLAINTICALDVSLQTGWTAPVGAMVADRRLREAGLAKAGTEAYPSEVGGG